MARMLCVLLVFGALTYVAASGSAQDADADRIATLETEVWALTETVRGLQRHATATESRLLPIPATDVGGGVGSFNGDEADKVRLYCSVGETPGNLRVYAVLDCFQVEYMSDPFLR